MTREEAIERCVDGIKKILEEWSRNHPKAFEEALESESIIIEALKKQEPEIVIDVSDGYAEGYDVFDEAECPTCGFYFESCDNIWKEPYCPHCGQALIWEVEE